MDTGLEALATALYVTVDDLLKDHPEVLPPRPRVGITAVTSDAEISTLAVVQALLGYTSERHWIRHAHRHLRPKLADDAARFAFGLEDFKQHPEIAPQAFAVKSCYRQSLDRVARSGDALHLHFAFGTNKEKLS